MFNKEKLLIFVLLSFTALLGLDLFMFKGIFTAHDIEANIARFAAIFISFKEGHLWPTWAGYLANGYGSPILIFSYTLLYYLELPLKLIGFTLIDATKIYIILAFIFSAYFMYLFLKRNFSSWASFIGTLFYVYAPYRINDIYARGSLSEHTAFIIIPIVGIALDNLSRKMSGKNVIFLSFSLFLLLLAHPFYIVITFPFFALYSFYLFVIRIKEKRKFLFKLFISFIIFISLGFFLLAPLLFESKYLHADINPFSGAWRDQFIGINKLIIPQWTFVDITGKLEYQTWQLGLVHLVVLILSISLLFVRKLQKKGFLILGLLSFLVSIFLMLSVSYPLYETIFFLRSIQFPWRFLGLSVLSLSFLSSVLFENIFANSKRTQKITFSFLVMFCLVILYLPYAKGHDYKQIDDDYYMFKMMSNSEGIGTTPVWAALPDKYQRASLTPKIIEGKGNVNLLYRSGTRHVLEVSAKTPVRLVDDTLYFPGWTVFADGIKSDIEFQNPNQRGLITFPLSQGKHYVEIVFLDTKLRFLSKSISLITFILAVIYLIYSYFRGKRLKV
ncbi:MAG: hypothetical protein UT63_C0011G0014 [Candidatus Gottesmanbacteria bacterium GW2011_GWC2_39_8]|uniref:Membrane protein 6-pyruvoyl-tetrahydropterin synthase-related domain-containing protein n=1 Tax=Candidatus Gottesmanbacteria bacterium GW2011_GWC2_39_8 TaxID=1618450 RepID=A0A0G0T7K9_9BACT|nr:MAG: hypothetical protein UT63_C0011G0014 [Candidatus Gottesmanbacteria bacterium GW2011_GWC2_39_8]